jgi:hypothetical protein
VDIALQFVTREGIYVFPQKRQISMRDNFGNVVTRTTRLPGTPGAYDEYGDGPAPGEVGNVQVFLWVEGDTPREINAELEMLRSMTDWGAGRLLKRVMDDPGIPSSERWCEARLSNVDFSQSARDLPHQRQRVQVNFQVANPYWVSQGTEGNLWNDGIAEWDDGVTYWGGALAFTELDGLENSFSVELGGNAPAQVRIDLRVPSGESAQNVRVRRVLFGAPVDEISYNAVLTAGQRLIVDTRSLAVMLNGEDAFGAAFGYLDPRWFWLMPGTNNIQVLMNNVSDKIEIRMLYYEMWKK